MDHDQPWGRPFPKKTLLEVPVTRGPSPPAKKRRVSRPASEEPLGLLDFRVQPCETKEERLVVEIKELHEQFKRTNSLTHHHKIRLGMALVTFLSHEVKIPEKMVNTCIVKKY